MTLVDTHIHLDELADWEAGDPLAEEDAEAIVPGILPSRTVVSVERLAADPRLAFGAAVHPWWSLAPNVGEWTTLEAVARDPRVTWIGETGLDHVRHRSDADRAACERAMRRHLELAHALDKPVILHCVRAHEDCIRVLGEMPATRGIVHAFSGSLEQAAAYRRRGYLVGIGSAVTSERSRRVRRLALELGPSDFVLETDAPFMAAANRARGDGRPADLCAVATTVAAMRGVTVAALAASANTALRTLAPGTRTR